MNECLSFRWDSKTTLALEDKTRLQSYSYGDITWWRDHKKMEKKHYVDVPQSKVICDFVDIDVQPACVDRISRCKAVH